MVASLLFNETATRAVADALHPKTSANGLDPEERIVFSSVSWQQYLEVDKAFGDDCPGPRLYFLGEELEIMSTSGGHERINKWLGGFLEIYFEERGIEIFTRGQATMRLPVKLAGAEPDDSWCIGEEKKFPDLVLEVALTSGGIPKLKLYQRFQVPEVWFWRRGKLEIHALRADGSGYDPAPGSQFLPGLDPALLERCVAIPSWLESRKAFRAGLAAQR